MTQGKIVTRMDLSPSNRRRLRLYRTLLVHRWHAAQTIGEWFGNDVLGERFEHINHIRSLVQYVWRFGAFAESPDGNGRVRVANFPHSLKEIVEPVAAKGRRHLEMAVGYVSVGGDRTTEHGGRTLASGQPNPDQLHRYAAKHPDVRAFAQRLVGLHRAMLPYYVQMRYLTPAEAERYRRGPIPVLDSLLTADGRQQQPFVPSTHGHAPPASPGGGPAGNTQAPQTDDTDDLVDALRNAFARNIHNALACRARAELFETLAAAPQGHKVASEATAAAPRDAFTTAALVHGARKRFVVHDRALAAMLKSIHEPPMPPLIRWLAAIKTAVSAMITTMPVFIVKNFFRDTLAGFVAGRYRQVPFLGTLSGAVEAFKDMTTGRSKAMHDYLLQGGFYSGLVESETDLGPTRSETGVVRRGVVARQKWAKLVHLLTRPAWLAEAGTRLDQFQMARRAGATDYAAARAARMVSSDFANIGASRGWRMYVHTVPFLNAALQGLDQLYQILRPRWRPDPNAPKWTPDQEQHVRKVATMGAYLAVASLAAWAYNVSDPGRQRAYQAETEYEKASWVTLYDLVGDADVRIPVPFQIGAVFIKLPEVAIDLVTGSETLAGPRFLWSMVHGNLWLGWKPAAVQPIIEVYTNRNFFGSEIIPPYMRYWPPEQQFFHRSTPLPYRAVGELFGVSPLHVQTFWRGWTGHLGNFVAVFLDERMWDQSAHGPKPFPRTLPLLTGVYSLQTPMPRTYTRYGDEFYEIADWADAAVRGRNCRNSMRMTRRTAAACEANRVTNRVAREASNLRSEGDDVRTRRTMSRTAKEAALVRIYNQIDDGFRRVLPEVQRLRRTAGG